MPMNTINPSKRRNETINIRCTPHEKLVIKQKAARQGKTISTYAINAVLAGRETHREKDKRMAKDLVELTQSLDDCYRYLNCENIDIETLKTMLAMVMEGAGKLWENL